MCFRAPLVACFQMTFLPWLISVPFFHSNDLFEHDNTVLLKSSKSGFDLAYHVFIWRETNATFTEYQSFWHMLQAWMTLNCCRNFRSSNNSTLPDSKSRTLILHCMSYHRSLCSSLHERILCMDHFFNFSNFSLISFICSSSFKMTSSKYSFYSKIDFESRLFFIRGFSDLHLFPNARWTLSVVSTLISFSWSDTEVLRVCSQTHDEALSECGCCRCNCCCCVCHLLLRVILCAGRSAESLSNKIRSPFREVTL